MNRTKTSCVFKTFALATLLTFTVATITPPASAQVAGLPVPGAVVNSTQNYAPVIIKGITVHPEKPLHFEFIVDTGDSGLDQDTVGPEAEKLIKYFLAALTIKETDKWVNLSPYEKDRIIPEALGVTEMGRDMLAQDYMLKQLSASLMNPDDGLGSKFWDRVYAKAQQIYGTTDIPMDTFNKIWIIPDQASVYEHDQSAYVVEKHLKVMMEEDYTALKENLSAGEYDSTGAKSGDPKIISGLTSALVRDVLLPEIEREVNEGETFANLRQIYNSMILAAWYKQALKESLLVQAYANRGKTAGVDHDDPRVNQKIFDQYVESFRRGVYDLLREDYDPASREIIVRKYFSGGEDFNLSGKVSVVNRASLAGHPDLEEEVIAALGSEGHSGQLIGVAGDFFSASADNAMIVENGRLYTLQDILKDGTKRLKFFDPEQGKISESSLPDFSRGLDAQYNSKFLGGIAAAAEEAKTKEELLRQHLLAEFERMKIVKRWFDIGDAALDLKDKNTQNRNYLAAMWAFNKVKEMKPTLRDVFAETTLTSDAFKPIKEVYDFFLTREKAEDLKQLTPERLGMTSKDFPKFMGALKEYLSTLDLIKLAEKRYRDSYHRYMAQVLQQSSLATAAIENIVYDLRMSDFEIFSGVDNPDGRSFPELIKAAEGLRELLFSNHPEITNAMKTQAAYFLSALFSQHMYFGSAYAQVDPHGGLMVSRDVQKLDFEGKSLADFKKAETEVFFNFLYERPELSLKHSYTAMAWLDRFYRKLGDYFYFAHGDQLLEKESPEVNPELSALFKKLAEQPTLDHMLDIYEEEFPQISKDFLNGSLKGARGETPVRIEFHPAGIADSMFLSSVKPYLMRGLFNGSLLLNRSDGTLGRPIQATFEIVDLNTMPKTPKGRSFISIRSLDRDFRIDFTDAGDILKKTKGDLVMQALVSMGLLPYDLMKKAKEEKREREVLKKVFSHFLGEGKGILINLYVDNVQQASGLAVSSMISAVIAQTFHEITNAQSRDLQTEYINRVTIDVSQDPNAATAAYYYVEIGADGDFTSNKTYRFAAQEKNGKIVVDVPVGQFPQKTEDRTYGIRYVKIQDYKFEDGNEVIEDELWTRDIPPAEFKNPGNIDLLEEGPEETRSYAKKKITVAGKHLEYRMVDDQKSVERAIYASQFTVRRLAGKAGVQDEVAGWQGGLRILNGRSGHFIPEMMQVSMPGESMELLNKFMRIMRIGKSQPAEDTLDEVFYNTILNRSLDAQYAWGQVSINAVMEAQKGNILGLGRLALAAVALRHQIAPVSIDYVTANTMNEFLYQYGEQYGLYGISGARMTGAVTRFFKPGTPEADIAEKMEELSRTLYQNFLAQGKLELIEQEPTVYRASAISPRGARVLFMDQEEMAVQDQVLKAQTALNRALSLHNQKKYILYTPEEYQTIKDKRGLGHVEDPVRYDQRSGLTMAPALQAKAKEIADRVKDRPLTDAERDELRGFAEELLTKAYRPFVPQDSWGHAQEEIRTRIKHTINLINELNQDMSFSSSHERALTEAFESGACSLTWDWIREDLERVAETLLWKPSEWEELIEELKEKYSIEENEQLFKNARTFRATEGDGDRIDNEQFYKDVDDEIKAKEKLLKTNGSLSRPAKREIEQTLELLRKKTNPLLLPHDHFLFRSSRVYRQYFETKIRLLTDLIQKGALVPDFSIGGMGSRFFGGRVIKGVYPFHFGQMADANFLKLLFLRWADLFKSFPQGIPPLFKVQTSLFTQSAVEAQFEDIAAGTGISGEQILSPELQSAAQAYWVRPEDMLVELLNITAATPAEYAEKVRDIQRMLDEAQRQTALAQHKDPNVINAPYNLEGSNPLLMWNPRGNIGILETDHAIDERLTVENLRKMGYTINQERLQWMQNAGLQDELEDGMPLAKAHYLVNNQGLSFGVTQNVSNLGLPGGGEILLAESLFRLTNDSEKFAVAQYVNTAGSPDSQGGIMAVDQGGHNVVLEMSRMTLAEGAVFEGYTAFNTNTMVYNRELWAKILGFPTLKAFLITPVDQIRKKLWDIFYKNDMIMYTLKDREFAVPGQSYKYKVVQGEVSVGRFLEYVQHVLGISAVDWVEAPIESFKDPKERLALGEAVGQEMTHRMTRSKTLIPEGEVEDALVSARDWLTWAQESLNRGAHSRVGSALHRAKDFIGRLDDSVAQPLQQDFDGILKTIEDIPPPKRSTNVSENWTDYENNLMQEWALQYNPEYNIYEKIRKREREEVEARLEAMHERIQNIESEFYWEAAGIRDALLSVIEEIRGEDIPYPAAIAIAGDMAAELILGEDLEELIHRFFGEETYASGQAVLRVKAAVDETLKRKHPAKPSHFIRELAYLRQEYTALSDVILESVLLADDKLKGIRTSEHKTMIITDKDATIETPGEGLKQAAYPDRYPGRARELIDQARQGMVIKILTGSTYSEAFSHVLDIIADTLEQYELSPLEKQMVAMRLEVLPNDGSVRARIFVNQSGRVEAANLEFVQRYFDGKFLPPTSLFVHYHDTEVMRNRTSLWSANLRAYLKQLFSESGAWELLTGNSSRDEAGRAAFEEFVDHLKVRGEMLDKFFEHGRQTSAHLNIHKSMAWVLAETMADKFWGDAGLSEGAKAIARKVKNIFADYYDEKNNILDEERFHHDVVRNISHDLTSQDKLLALLGLIHFKESAWTYGSITGDELDKVRKDPQGRFSSLVDMVLNPGFWDGVAGNFIKQIETMESQGGFYALVDQDEMKILKEIRPGPGYLNEVFGGVNKKTTSRQYLELEQYKGWTFVFSGDSIKDQGDFPYTLIVPVQRIAKNVGQKFEAGDIIELMGVVRHELVKHKKIGLANRLKYDEKEGLISFEGEMLKTDYDLLSSIDIYLNGDSVSGGAFWKNIAQDLYAQSRHVFRDRISLRYLLGTLFELDAQQIERVMDGGLMRLLSRNTMLSPFDLSSNERPGPATFYFMMQAISKAVRKQIIIPFVNDEESSLEMLTRFERAVIEAANTIPGTPGSRFIPSNRQYQRNRAGADSARTTSLPTGGIDLNEKLLSLRVERDDKGMLVPIDSQLIESIRRDVSGLIPVITDIYPILNLPAKLGLQVQPDGDGDASADGFSDDQLSLETLGHPWTAAAEWDYLNNLF